MQTRLSLSGEMPPPWLRERFSGIGLIRGEYLLRSHEEYVTVPACQERIADYLDRVARMFAPDPVWYRATELTTDEANTLAGVDAFFHEADPMKGLRGLRRSLQLPSSFLTEAKVVAEVARAHPNLHILLPFVMDADEFEQGLELLSRIGWPTRVGCMLEIPSAILDVERIVAAGAANLLLGFNDLSSLMTGASRATWEMKLHLAVWWAVTYVRDRVPASCEWGIAGDLKRSVVERAQQEQVPYVSLHYHELDTHLGIAPADLPDHHFVYLTKVKTRSQIAAARLRADLGLYDITIP